MKKLLSLMSVLLAFLMLLSACGAPAAETSEPPAEDTGSEAPPAEESPAEAEPVTITYCNFNASGGNEETLAKMYEAFHEEYPNITVEIETIGFDDYFTQMQTRVAGGTAPDCYELNIENFASYAAKGALAEITGVANSGTYPQIAMLKAIAALAEDAGLHCQVSMEERMGCGIGACLVCACALKSENGETRYGHVCKDGPVFNAEEVEW